VKVKNNPTTTTTTMSQQTDTFLTRKPEISSHNNKYQHYYKKYKIYIPDGKKKADVTPKSSSVTSMFHENYPRKSPQHQQNSRTTKGNLH
jgi:hypothetical protein